MPNHKRRYCLDCGTPLYWRPDDQRFYCKQHATGKARTYHLTTKAICEMDGVEMKLIKVVVLPRWMVDDYGG